MFTYCPMDVTSHIIVSMSVFTQCNCCALCNNMFHVFFYLIWHSAYIIIIIIIIIITIITIIIIIIIIIINTSSVQIPSHERRNNAAKLNCFKNRWDLWFPQHWRFRLWSHELQYYDMNRLCGRGGGIGPRIKVNQNLRKIQSSWGQ